MLSPQEYGAYFAFLVICLIIVYDKLEQLHTPIFIGVVAALAICSIFVENPGLFIIVCALLLESWKVYLLKNRVHP